MSIEYKTCNDMSDSEGECVVEQGTVLIDSNGTMWIVMPSDDDYHLNGSVMKVGAGNGPVNACRMHFPVVISDEYNRGKRT